MQGIFATPLRAMVLCAGMGSRLGGISDELPKPLLPVCNHPLVTYALSLCRGYGMREVAINLHHLGHLITNTVGNGASLGMDIHYSSESTLLGTGGGVRKMAEFLTHDFREPCVVINGKLVVDVDLEAVLALHRVTGAAATMVLRETPDADEWGAVEVDGDGRVYSILGQKSPAQVAKPPRERPAHPLRRPEEHDLHGLDLSQQREAQGGSPNTRTDCAERIFRCGSQRSRSAVNSTSRGSIAA